MPHADSSYLPKYVKSKGDLWAHILEQLAALVGEQRNWVSNCANASSLIYYSLQAFPSHFGAAERTVNWCGFYIDSQLFPAPRFSKTNAGGGQGTDSEHDAKLLLGPFSGRPACQFISVAPGRTRGVCADAFIRATSVVVSDVEAYPGHIACDGLTKSELVCPLVLNGKALGVLDLDCIALGAFDEEDRQGVERVAQLLAGACDW